MRCTKSTAKSTEQVYKEWEQQKNIRVKPFPQKTGVSIKSTFSPKASDFYPQTIMVHQNKAECSKAV